MGRYKNMKLSGGSVELTNMPEYIEKVMLMAGMDKLADMPQRNSVTDDERQGEKNG